MTIWRVKPGSRGVLPAGLLSWCRTYRKWELWRRRANLRAPPCPYVFIRPQRSTDMPRPTLSLEIVRRIDSLLELQGYPPQHFGSFEDKLSVLADEFEELADGDDGGDDGVTLDDVASGRSDIRRR